MKHTLHNLIELQKIDEKLHALEAMKGDLPLQIQRLEDDVNRNKDLLTTYESELDDAKKTKLHWEGELKVLQEKHQKYQDQLYAVTTNKEYDAITAEIDAIKEKMDEAENLILEAIEKEEKFSTEVEEQQSQVAALEENLRVKTEELKTKIKATEQETSEYEKQRAELVSHISKPVLYQYERIRKGIGNTAVSAIYKYSCGGCHAAIPPQKVVEIRTMTQLILCESCGRILVSAENREPAVVK